SRTLTSVPARRSSDLQLTTALAESGEQGEDVLHGRVDLCPVPLEVGAHLEVLAHSHLAEDDASLGHIPEPDREDAVRALADQAVPVEHDLTAEVGDEPHDDFEG